MLRHCIALLFALGLALPLCAQEIAPPPPVPAPPPPAPVAPPPRPWSGGLEFGLNGADGNSELFKTRLGGNLKYETPDRVQKFDFLYNYATANSVRTENRVLANGRTEWLFRDSPWGVFVSDVLEADEFKAFDLRLGIHTGLTYTWWKTASLLLKSRAGAGGSWEFGGPENRFMPEALLGGDLEWKLSDRQKFTSNVDVFPELGRFGDYRVQAKMAYELLIDPTWNLTLKLGALDRYDSTPQGRKRNDIEYFAVLLWKF